METQVQLQPIPGLAQLHEDDFTEITVEVSPGLRRHVKVPKGRPPKFLVQRLVKNGRTGEYFCIPTAPHGPCIRLGKNTPRDLGLPIGIMTLKRLIYAGFIRAYRLGPFTTLVDLASIWEHLHATEVHPSKPLFWTQEKCLKYSEWRAYGTEEDLADPEDD